MYSTRAYRCCALALLLAALGCRSENRLVIFAAASMGPSLDVLRPMFEAEHPGVRVEIELSSSRQACTKVVELGRAADLVISADESVLLTVLAGRAREMKSFAKNRLVVAAARDSTVGKRLATMPWQLVLADPTVRVGMADPKQAPVGERTLHALHLNDTLVDDQALQVGAAITARLAGAAVRPDVSKLIAPLETGELDAAFVYATEAHQYGFAFQELDPRIDGSDSTRYAVALVDDAPNPKLAEAFVALLTSEAGLAVLRDKHLAPDVRP